MRKINGSSPMMKIGKKTPLGMGRETAIATKMYCGGSKTLITVISMI